LPQPADPAPELPAETATSEVQADLARDLQRELARVGCAAGRADGIWGARSRDALREFNRYAKASLDPDVPSKDALTAVQKQQGRVCPGEPVRARSKDTVRPRERAKAVERAPATTTRDWRSISPLCQSGYTIGSRMCCTYDPPSGPPRIICP
jgi:peptidoglycan hydrolase-like protein with peptidoglycan-binding domain